MLFVYALSVFRVGGKVPKPSTQAYAARYAGAVGSFVGTALVVCLRVGRLWVIVNHRDP